MVRITDRPNMTSAVYRGRKALNKTNKFINNYKNLCDLKDHRLRFVSVTWLKTLNKGFLAA